ncbi:hypothetical protein NDU88_005771 [Pleurodeles waltl]|uniref:Uncharacterized protein n=1 Tax=Pleurodeles waltl TaxID=8319 RepID=A0AAV7LM44_PLEWA|nr:hypothetical protein NDU88_005771 [Pleurodeles waltl]
MVIKGVRRVPTHGSVAEGGQFYCGQQWSCAHSLAFRLFRGARVALFLVGAGAPVTVQRHNLIDAGRSLRSAHLIRLRLPHTHMGLRMEKVQTVVYAGTSCAKMFQIGVSPGVLGAPRYELYYAATQIQWVVRWLRDSLTLEVQMVHTILGHTNVLRWLLAHEGPLHSRNTLLNVARLVRHRYVLLGSRTPQYSPRIPLMAAPNVGKVAGKHGLTEMQGP